MLLNKVLGFSLRKEKKSKENQGVYFYNTILQQTSKNRPVGFSFLRKKIILGEICLILS